MEAVAADRAGYADALDGMLQVVRTSSPREEAGLITRYIAAEGTSAVRRMPEQNP